jgi:signal transduction histidine kinase/DNA-binding response OmpR family regulator/HPt (histidine-containing phosphotransfer) domain-containing protein
MNKTGPDSEKLRLAALKEFQILDTLPEQEFDDIALLASQICETPIAAISLIDENRQWFKSRIGLPADETPRDHAFCDHAIKRDELFVVPDAAEDFRFSANPLVTKDPYIRFYAGAPLITSDGFKLGTLCVIDRKPRNLSGAQARALSALARSVMSLIEARNAAGAADLSKNDDPIRHFSKINDEVAKEQTFFNRYVKHYLIATLIIIVVTLIKLALDTVTQLDAPYLLFAGAILLAAWRGGLGAGLYATLATVLVINYFFIAPSGSLFGYSFKQNLLFLIFVGQGVFISLLCASRLRGERLLYQAGSDLENRVTNRTRLLAQVNKELKQEIQERNFLQEDLRRARDSAVESVRLKSEFLANMSHEIRTPMNGVIGMTGLLLETELDSEQRRFAGTIRTSGESLLTIINDILDFSKVEAGKLELETLDFELRETIESLIDLFSDRAREQRNELAALIYSDVPLFVRGDAGRIRQILTNLIGNAIKFTKHGDIVVRVKKIRETSASVQLNFSVTDTGEGISDEVQARLFQPFTQSDASTTRRFGGTGLGLSISKKLVEMMDGEIGLESRVGRGANFWFNITLEKQEAISPIVSDYSSLAPNYEELSGKRVLIIDDNEVNREILIHQTRSWKMTPAESGNGLDGVELLEKAVQPFDLVIVDAQMPIVNGLETARRIISVKNKNQPVPAILMLSSNSFKMNAETMQELGVKAFLRKPYRQSDLLEMIYKALGISWNEIHEDTDIHITSVPETETFPPAGRSKRILIVEDNTVNQMVAQNLLKKFGYHADVAANGIEALHALEIIPYDLILMDCQMPEMDGYEATHEIRARNWSAARLPIIALTAHATAGEREKCLRAGMNDHISKPIEKESLRRIVAYWLASTENKDSPVSPNDSPESSSKDGKTPVGKPAEISLPAVDLATLDDITDNNAEIRREVVEIYLVQTVTNLFEIEQAISTNDADKLYEAAHKTVGGSALCGMRAIVEPLRKLEQLGRAGKTAEALPYFTEAQNAFAAIDRECREILDK